MAAHCSSLMRRTSIPIPHAVTSPAPPLHPLQPLQTTCHGAAEIGLDHVAAAAARSTSLAIRNTFAYVKHCGKARQHGGKWHARQVWSGFPIQYDLFSRSRCLPFQAHTPDAQPEHQHSASSGAGAHHLKSSLLVPPSSRVLRSHARLAKSAAGLAAALLLTAFDSLA